MVMDELADAETALRSVSKRVADVPIEAGDLVGVLASVGKCKRLAHSITLTATRRAEELRAHVGTGAKDVAAFCATASGGEVTDARRDQRVDEQLTGLPLVDAAVRDGALGERAAADIAVVASRSPTRNSGSWTPRHAVVDTSTTNSAPFAAKANRTGTTPIGNAKPGR
jgi:hypothetical protein